jgi:hypothetical protein
MQYDCLDLIFICISTGTLGLLTLSIIICVRVCNSTYKGCQYIVLPVAPSGKCRTKKTIFTRRIK